ncbi:SDR family oxidoreductase [Streptomyces sp. NPDC050636]|uniref:SDR family oxidoreductase n=1 Tax=Streptomyces sp. NPDC050636 TaxID=3154510 RepID=UPI0034179145
MILVIGATGTVGSEVVRQLADKGVATRSFVRDAAKARRLLGENAEFVAGDLDDPASVAAALHGVRRVFLVSAVHPLQDARERAVVEAARQSDVEHLVRVSTGGARPDSPAPVCRWHWEADEALAKSGIPYTVLKPSAFMQNLFQMVDDGAIASATGQGTDAMVDARDIAALAVEVLTGDAHFGRTYTVTGPRDLTHPEVASLISAAAGTEIRHVPLTTEQLRDGLTAAGLPQWYVADLVALQLECASGLGVTVHHDFTEVTGRPPRSIEDFLSEYAGQFRGA